MKARPQRPFAWLGLVIAVAITTLAVAGLLAASAPVAFAQEGGRGWSLRDLFFPRRTQRYIPREDVAPPRQTSKPRTKSPRKTTTTKVAEPEVVVDAKTPDAKTVLVVGDFIGSGLAEGLNILFAANPKVRVVDRTKGASGFVREDHFDWPGSVTEIVAAEKPATVVVLIGANDRQQMRIGDRRETLRSEAWAREYSARAASFASAVFAADVPLVWVGTIPFKSTKSSSDLLAINEIYRKVSADVGAEFIDVWDGFVDEKGAFVTTGPDISGQPARLRSGDGINLTTAGKRKLAFYTEKTLKRLLGEAGTGAPTTPGHDLPAGQLGPTLPADRTAPMALSDPELDGGTELLGATVTLKSPAQAGGKVPSTTSDAAIGRVDDFSRRRREALVPAADSTATASTRSGTEAAKTAN